MMQPLRVPYALEWPDRTCLARYPIWTPSTLVTPGYINHLTC